MGSGFYRNTPPVGRALHSSSSHWLHRCSGTAHRRWACSMSAAQALLPGCLRVAIHLAMELLRLPLKPADRVSSRPFFRAKPPPLAQPENQPSKRCCSLGSS